MKTELKFFYLFILFAVFVDQVSKYFIIEYFNINPELLINDFLYEANQYLNIVIVWNKGFAFGLFQNNIFSINILYIFLIGSVILVLIVYAYKLNQKYYFLIFGLIIGGALGNLIDRILYGAVVDFIDLHYINLNWYVFNIADICISIVCILLVLAEIRKKPSDKLK
jgi:signal peptidase II